MVARCASVIFQGHIKLLLASLSSVLKSSKIGIFRLAIVYERSSLTIISYGQCSTRTRCAQGRISFSASELRSRSSGFASLAELVSVPVGIKWKLTLRYADSLPI